MELVKPNKSGHDLINFAKRIGEGHWQAVHDGEFFDNMGEAAPTKYSIGKYDSKQYQAIMYRELTISSDVPPAKLNKALKTGTLSLTADQLKGSGSVIHLNPGSYEKAIEARKAGRGVRFEIIKHEIKKRAQGGSVWGKIKFGLFSAFKFVRDSGLLSTGLDAAVPALATAFGPPQATIPARAAIKSLTGVGICDSDCDVEKERGRLSIADVRKTANHVLSYAKRKGILIDAVDAGEKFLLSKASKPKHETLSKSVRGEVRRGYGVGVAKGKRSAKGSQEAKDHMARIRAMRKEPMQAGSI